MRTEAVMMANGPTVIIMVLVLSDMLMIPFTKDTGSTEKRMAMGKIPMRTAMYMMVNGKTENDLDLVYTLGPTANVTKVCGMICVMAMGLTITPMVTYTTASGKMISGKAMAS